jgi:hypothetical protein
MGFINSATTINIKVKLTPTGRQKLANNGSSSITSFMLGDSDANYSVYSGLTYGQIPDFSGDNFGLSLNNGGNGYQFKSNLIYRNGQPIKPVQLASSSVTIQYNQLGYNTLNYSGGTLTQTLINRNDYNTNTLVNLFYSFGLPINTSTAEAYTGITSNNGGFLNTALSGLASENILVIGINGSQYGEMIDGKSLKLELDTLLTTYDIYGTYENNNLSLNIQDSNIVDNSLFIKQFGPNTCLLFSDTIQRPNNDLSKSWSTGYSLNRPYSLNGKSLWNFRTNVNTNTVADKPVGIAYLDKGFLVITEPTIVNNFILTGPTSSATTVTFNSVIASVSQKATCIADRGEFTTTTNNTYSTGDTPRITEIGLLDNSGNLIAIAKTNRTYYKPTDDIVVFNLTIDY